MATKYEGPDQWIAQGRIPVGVGSGDEPIKTSWVATNRAAHQALGIVAAIQTAINGLAAKVVEGLIAHRWVYGNQENTPEKNRGKNNVFEAVAATNTLVYSPAVGLVALNRKLDAIAAKVGVTPGTYTVAAGDTLIEISAATGVSVDDLVKWNNLANPDQITEGQVLKLQP